MKHKSIPDQIQIPKGFKLIFSPKYIFPHLPDSLEGKNIFKETSQENLRKHYCFQLLGPSSSALADNKESPWFYWIVKEKKHDKSGTRDSFKAIPKQYLHLFHKDFKKISQDYLKDPYKLYADKNTGKFIFDHRYLVSKIPPSQQQKRKKSNDNDNQKKTKQQQQQGILTFEVDPHHIKQIEENIKKPQRNPQWNIYEIIVNDFPLDSIEKVLNLNSLSVNKEYLGMWREEFIIQDPQIIICEPIQKKKKISDKEEEDDDEQHLASLINEENSESSHCCCNCGMQVKDLTNQICNTCGTNPFVVVEMFVDSPPENLNENTLEITTTTNHNCDIKVNISPLWLSIKDAIFKLKNFKMMENDSRFNSETDIGKEFSAEELDIMMNIFILFFPIIDDDSPCTPFLEIPQHEESGKSSQLSYQWIIFSLGNIIYRKKIECTRKFIGYELKSFNQKTISTELYEICQDDLWYQLKGYCQKRNVTKSKFESSNSYEDLLDTSDIISKNKNLILNFFDYVIRFKKFF